MVTVEICVEDASDLAIASQTGADRVEVTRALETGGLTPPDGLIEHALSLRFPKGVRVLVRENPAGFELVDGEALRLAETIKRIRGAFPGTESTLGFVVGGLTAGALDVEAAALWKEAAGSHQLVFHRAFDAVFALGGALSALAELGYHGVLTTGGKPSEADPEALQKLVELNSGVTVIGSGRLREDNIARVITQADLREVHFRVPADKKGHRDRGAVRRTIDAVRSI